MSDLNQSYTAVKTATIKTARIETGKARAEGRAPSHDGEYITIYYVPGNTADIIAEHNAGTFCLQDEGLHDIGLPESEEEALREEWNAIRDEAHEIVREDKGETIRSAGSEARDEMILLGWATADDFDDDSYVAHG
jgi:hypothetical protein